MVAYAKQNPDRVAYATPGQYATPHLGMEGADQQTRGNQAHACALQGGAEGTRPCWGGRCNCWLTTQKLTPSF
ncbi:hypothetical protein J8I82_27690 [Cupriavidus sp. LEh25]|nr:hypothetical protein [Cupriavidus sp. LEh25]